MADAQVQTRDNGPLLVTGEFKLVDHEGNAFDTGGKPTIAICRCGASNNKPFCDGSHNGCGFQSAERAPAS